MIYFAVFVLCEGAAWWELWGNDERRPILTVRWPQRHSLGKLIGGGQLFENKRKTRDHAVNNRILGLLAVHFVGKYPCPPTSYRPGWQFTKKQTQIKLKDKMLACYK